ncbi:uncharacterized protein LOC144459386 [Epinephelus lanceolatus]
MTSEMSNHRLGRGSPQTGSTLCEDHQETTMAKASKAGRRNKGRKERRERKLNQWREDRMTGAIAEFREIAEAGGVPQLRLLARAWNVPKSTLQRRIKGDGNHHHTIGRKPRISSEDEAELAQLVATLGKRGFPLRMREIQKLAYQFAEKKGIKGFSDVAKKAGYKWFQGFLKRNKHLSIRKPEGLSAARAAGFNPTVVKKWFETYVEMVQTLGLENAPDHVWNCDETGLQDHFLSTRVVAEVGTPCFEVTGGEKGTTTTCLASINAAGGYGPTMIIFKGKRMKAEWVFGAPKNTFVRMSDNGWINADLFTEWGKCFLRSLPKDNSRPHLLLLDSHASHTYNIDFLNMMRENNVYVFSLPPHTTHYLQPADRALFKSLKHYWKPEGRTVTRENGGKRLDRALFMPLFSKAWERAATSSNAQAGFRGSGIYPFNPAKIDDSLFSPSLTSERSIQEAPVDPVIPAPGTSTCHASHDNGNDDEDFSIPLEWNLQQSLYHPLHDAVQPAISTPQSSPPHLLASSSEAPSSVAQEVEVMAQPEVSFQSLIKLPVRERASTSRQRVKPPPYNLTSEDHFSFVREKEGKKKGSKQKPREKKTRQGREEACSNCKHSYGDRNDPRSTEEWLSCAVCSQWFHQSCAEDNGVIDDDDSFMC